MARMLGRIGHGAYCHAEFCIDCGGYSDRRDARKQRHLEARALAAEIAEAVDVYRDEEPAPC